MNIVKYITNKMSIAKKIKKMIRILSVIDIEESNGSIIISVPDNVVVNTNGNLLLYSKSGVLITKHNRTHINPDIEFSIRDDLDNTVERAKIKRDLNSRIAFFTRALKLNRVHTKNKR